MSIEYQTGTLQRLDELDRGTLFRLNNKLFIRGHETMWVKEGFVLVCWDCTYYVHIGLGIDEWVEVVDDQAFLDPMFNRIDTVMRNLESFIKDINSEYFRCYEVHSTIVNRLKGDTGRLKSHLLDLREASRELWRKG